MKSKSYIEPFVYAVCAALCMAMGLSPLTIKILKTIRSTPAWGNFENGIQQSFLLFGLVFIVFLITSVAFLKRQRSFSREIFRWVFNSVNYQWKVLKERFKTFTQSGSDLVMLTAGLVLAVIPRAYYLSQPMRYDESYSYIKFVSRDLKWLFNYQNPNNHVLHSILEKISVSLFGVSPSSIRFPAFLAGVILVPSVYVLCRRMKLNGLLATVITGLSPYMIFFSTNSRGYMLLCLLIVWLIGAGLNVIQDGPTISKTLLFSVLAGLCMFVVPSALYAIAGIYIWVLIVLLYSGIPAMDIFLEFGLPAFLISSIITLIEYMPVIFFNNGLGPIINNRYVQALPISEFFAGIEPHILETSVNFSRDIPLLILPVGLGLLIFGLVVAYNRKNQIVAWLLPGTILGAMIIFLAKRSIPFPRTWIFFIPVFALIVDYGITVILEKGPKMIQKTILSTVMIVAFGATFYLISSDVISDYPDTGYFPEAELAATYLGQIADGRDRLYADTPADWPLYFYLRTKGYPIPYYDEKGKEPRNIYYVVQKSSYSITDLTQEDTILNFEYEDLAIYQKK